MIMESIPISLQKRLYRGNELEKITGPVQISTVLKFIIPTSFIFIACIIVTSVEIAFFFLSVMFFFFVVYLLLYSSVIMRLRLKKIWKLFYKLPETERKKYKYVNIDTGNASFQWPLYLDTFDKVFDVIDTDVENAKLNPCKECFFKCNYDIETINDEIRERVDFEQQFLTGCFICIVPFVVGEDRFCSNIEKKNKSLEKFNGVFNTKNLLGSLNDLNDKLNSIVDKNEKEKDDDINGLE
jgi:hypothetical protein